MRRRLLVALALFAAIAVLAFAVPLALVAAGNRTSELILDRGADADRFAVLATSAYVSGDPQVLLENVERYHALYGDGVLVTDVRGEVVAEAGVSPADPSIADAMAAATRGQRPETVARLLPWGPSTVVVARPVGTSVQVDGAVALVASTDAARQDISVIWAVVAAGGVIAMALFGLLAHAIGGWVLRPLSVVSQRMSDLTRSLPARGRTAPTADEPALRYAGPPEIRTLARSFDVMASTVRESTEAQRRLTADTAHTLRNPLTALTFRLDSLEPAVPDASRPTYDAAVTEVARLTHILDGLLHLAVAEENRGGRRPDDEHDHHDDASDAVAVVRDRIDAWHDAYARADMSLEVEVPDHAEVAVGHDALAQMLDAPLDNALRYAGAGSTVTVTVDAGAHVRISIVDDGVGVDPAETALLTERFYRAAPRGERPAGSGLGLSISRALATGHGGHVDIDSARPRGLIVRITLPAAP